MEKRYVYIILALCLFAFLVRVWPVEQSHWWDEAVYLQHAEVIYSGRTNYDEFELRPPLLPILFAGAYTVNHDVMTAGIVVALLGAIGVLFLYLLGRRLYGETAGLLAAGMLAVSPYFVTASHWIMTDVPSLTFITIAFYFLVLGAPGAEGMGRWGTLRAKDPSRVDTLASKAEASRSRSSSGKSRETWNAARSRYAEHAGSLFLALAGLFFAAAVLMRFTSLILLFVVPLYLFVTRASWRKALPIAAGGALLLLPYFLWVQGRYGFFLETLLRANNAVSDTVGGPLYYAVHFLDIYPLAVLVGIVLFVALAVVRGLRSRGRKALVGKRFKLEVGPFTALDLVLVLWIAVFVAYLTLTPHKEPRYIIPMAVPVFLLAARGFSALLAQRSRTIKYMTLAVFALLLIPPLLASAQRIQGPFVNAWQSEPVKVSEHLVSLGKPSGTGGEPTIYTNHDYPVYAYYTGMPVVRIEGGQDFYERYPKNMPEDGYLIVYRSTGKQPTDEWLSTQSAFRKLKTWDDVTLYAYRKDPFQGLQLANSSSQ